MGGRLVISVSFMLSVSAVIVFNDKFVHVSNVESTDASFAFIDLRFMYGTVGLYIVQLYVDGESMRCGNLISFSHSYFTDSGGF